MRTSTTHIQIMILLLAIPLFSAGCSTASPAGLTDEQVTAITANILTAIDGADYAAFTRDFSDDMLSAFSQEQFDELRSMLHRTSGNFISTGKLTISNNQDYALYRIICKYEEEDVVVTVVFRIDGTLVEGLFFDSPNLRSAG